MFEIGTRKLQQLTSGSLYINTPQSWVRHHKLKPQDVVRVSIDDKGRLVIEPVREENHNA